MKKTSSFSAASAVGQRKESTVAGAASGLPKKTSVQCQPTAALGSKPNAVSKSTNQLQLKHVVKRSSPAKQRQAVAATTGASSVVLSSFAGGANHDRRASSVEMQQRAATAEAATASLLSLKESKITNFFSKLNQI